MSCQNHFDKTLVAILRLKAIGGRRSMSVAAAGRRLKELTSAVPDAAYAGRVLLGPDVCDGLRDALMRRIPGNADRARHLTVRYV